MKATSAEPTAPTTRFDEPNLLIGMRFIAPSLLLL